jgi:hypothetical protein
MPWFEQRRRVTLVLTVAFLGMAEKVQKSYDASLLLRRL